METKFLKPRQGLVVRDPRTNAQLPADGMNVPWIGAIGRFFRRRVNCGDCVIVNESKVSDIEDKNRELKRGGGR